MAWQSLIQYRVRFGIKSVKDFALLLMGTIDGFRPKFSLFDAVFLLKNLVKLHVANC